MGIQEAPAGYKFIWQIVGGQQVQVLVPDLNQAPSIFNEVTPTYPWKYPVASLHELQSVPVADCEDGDVRMVLGVGVYIFWANSVNPTGLPPFDGQTVPGRWQSILEGGSVPTWVQTADLTWSPTMLLDASGITTLRVNLQGDTILNGGTGVDGQKLLLELTQGGTGNHAITLGTKFQFGTDITGIVFSILPGMTDYVGCVYNEPKDKWRVVAYSRGYQ